MTPEEFVRCIDFRYITDALTPEEAMAILKREEAGKAQRMKEAEANKAVPAYTTSAGWLGYGQDKMKGLLQQTLNNGYRHFKLKVGTSVAADKERLAIAREVIGYDKGNILMVDANQVLTNLLSFTLQYLLTKVGMVRPGSHRIHEAARRVQAVVHRGTHFPR